MSRVIRPAEIADAPALGRVHVECWREAYAHLLSAEFLAALDPHSRGEQWSTMLSELGPEDRVVVLEVDGELRGFASSGLSPEPEVPSPMLYTLYIYASEYGSGAGQELLDRVIPVGDASLWVADDNPRAQSFYRRNGFQLDGTRKSEPRAEELVEARMVRRIAAQ